MFRALVAVLIAGLFMSAPSRALAQDPVMEVVKKMKEVFEPVRPSTLTVDLTMTAGGETIHWVAREAMKQFPDGKRMVMVMLEPTEVKGNAYLIWEPKDKLSAVWTYMPVLRRVRELAGVDAYEHFLGTDFTYADLGFVRLDVQAYARAPLLSFDYAVMEKTDRAAMVEGMCVSSTSRRCRRTRRA